MKKMFVPNHKRGPGNPNAVNLEMIKRDRQAGQHEHISTIKATSPRTVQPYWPKSHKSGGSQKHLKAKIKLAPVSILNEEVSTTVGTTAGPLAQVREAGPTSDPTRPGR